MCNSSFFSLLLKVETFVEKSKNVNLDVDHLSISNRAEGAFNRCYLCFRHS